MGISPGLLKFSEWMPDLTAINAESCPLATNVFPRGDGYGPVPDFVAFTTALSTACRGLFFARNADGSITIFAATATNLYTLSNIDFTWVNVSKGGGPYGSVPTGANWQFVQFNNFVIVVQINTVPQVFDLTSSSAFADLGGSPPQASYIAVVNRFLVLGGISGQPYRVQWSGLNATTTWDNVTAQSNYQDLADGGRVTGITGGDQFGVIFQDSSIRSMIFAPGSPVIFDILRIASNDGLLSPFAAINAGDKIYFCSPQGFKVIVPGGYPEPIGKEKFDRTFFADLDTANLQLLIAATDPTTTRVYWAYKSLAGQAGLFDKILVYDRILNRATVIEVSGEFLTALSRPGLTLESLDSIAPGAISVSGAANNGSGLVRLTVSSTSGWTTGDIKAVSGIVGTTEANGNWTITVVNGTHIDLQGSVFASAYVSGGVVGGSLDALPFSLDSISLAALAQLAMVGPTHAAGFFTGSNLEGLLETSEQDGNGRRVFVSAVRPMTDCPTAAISIGARETAQGGVTYTAETTVDDEGLCPIDGGGIDTRYAKVRLRTPYGSVWTYAMGIEPEFRFTGWR